MTWREIYEEGLKTPAIGVEAWFQCIPSGQVEEAHRLIASKVLSVSNRNQGPAIRPFWYYSTALSFLREDLMRDPLQNPSPATGTQG